MMFELDHIAVVGEDLRSAVAHCETQLGLPMGPGGQHPHYATHNQLLGGADGLYLEAVAIDPMVPKPGYPRWFGLDEFSGPPCLDKWVLRCDDIDAALAAFPDIGSPIRLSRGDLQWTMIVPPDGRLPFDGLFPAFIQWHSDVPPGQSLPSSGLRLSNLQLTHPKAGDMAARLEGFFADARVTFVEDKTSGLRACYDTPDGVRRLR